MLPYSACQLCSYEAYKQLLGGGPNGEGLSVPRRLAAGAAAGMTSTLVTALPEYALCHRCQGSGSATRPDCVFHS